MSASALSGAQFGALRPQEADPEKVFPLPGAAQTYSSSQRAAIWRKPPGLSAQESTYGTFFNPFNQK